MKVNVLCSQLYPIRPFSIFDILKDDGMTNRVETQMSQGS